MSDVELRWFRAEDGGRKTPPSAGRYFAVARFAEDVIWQNNAWSVVFDLNEPVLKDGDFISRGRVNFLVDAAPKERLLTCSSFDIYEGPKKVATVLRV
jgi:hypothetical protein